MLDHNKINLIPVSKSNCFSSLIPIYYKINYKNQLKNSRTIVNYFSSPSPIYDKIDRRSFKSKPNDFLKLSSKISPLYIMLMVWQNAFDKKMCLLSVIIFWEEMKLKFYSFLNRIKLIKKIMLIKNTCNFVFACRYLRRWLRT